MPISNSFALALAMTTLAGLSTGLGGLLVLFAPPKERTVAFALGFAGGVMLCVALVSILPEGVVYYRTVFASPFAAGCAAASLLLIGMVLAGLLGNLLPEENALFVKLIDEPEALSRARALHCGMAVAVALMLHNLPEGILTLFTGVSDLGAGVRLCIAIAMHNIPEGISIAAPLWYATHSRLKSAGAAFLSGLAEPVGALLAYFLLRDVLSQGVLHGISLVVAGAMCWVSGGELLFGGFAMRQKTATCMGFSFGIAAMLLGISAFS